MAERAVSNCQNNASATKEDVTPDDNGFKCPVTASWVELKLNDSGKIVCTKDTCGRWMEDPENQ
jgi:hypothetical protein